MMERVYKDKWLWLFLVMGILTFIVSLNAAENALKIRRAVDWIYGEMQSVRAQNANSKDDRAEIHDRLERLESAIERLERR